MSIVLGMEGPAHAFAPDEENLGFRVALAEANEEGGAHGRVLETRAYPRRERAEAVHNARRLMDRDRVFALLNFGGPASLEIARLATERRVPFLFPHTGLLPREASRYVFTSFPRYETEAAVLLRYLVEEAGVRRVGVLHAANAYGRFFLERVQALGERFAGAQPLADEHPRDVEQELVALRAGEPDALILALYPEQARAVMQAKGRMGWKVRMVSAGPLTDEQLLNVPGGHAEGTLGFCYYPDPERAAVPGLAAYREAMARRAPGRALNRYSLYGWVFGRLVIEGLRRAPPEPTQEQFIDAMEAIRGWDSGGILPPVSFSPQAHHAQHAGMICELRGGRLEPLTGWVGA